MFCGSYHPLSGREAGYKMPEKLRVAAKLLFLALFAEIFIFNYRHWESFSNQEIADYGTVTLQGLIREADGSYLVTEDKVYLEFPDLNRRLDTLFLDIEPADGREDVFEPVIIEHWARDESHEEYYGLPSRELWPETERSKYFTYHLYGDCRALRISPGLQAGEHIRLRFLLNPVIPLFFSWYRTAALLGFLIFCCLFRPSSWVWQIAFTEMKTGRNAAITAFLLGNMLLLYIISGLNPFFQQESLVQQREYQSLARALSKGQLFLEEEPGEALKAMENPYDYAHRARVLKEAGEDFLWDHAYYEGRYYVYFGVVPAVLFYLPCYVLTGEDLHNRTVILIGAFLMLAAITGIMDQIIKRWFPKTSLGAWFLLSELMAAGSGLIYMCKRTDMYTVPIITGLAFGLLGLWHFLCAGKGDGGFKRSYLAAGSFLMALTAGCRPQIFLTALLCMVPLRGSLFSLSRLRSGEGRRDMAAVAVPMAAVAFLLMWYNHARFGSVFDFGANYNLCFNDMRMRGFVWDRLPLGIWAYLFAPFKITLNFPFLEANYFASGYLGVTISEATYGGLFAVSPFVWMCPALLFFGRSIKKNPAWETAIVSMAAGTAIVLADTQMSGILMRYFSDFSIFFVIAAVLSWLLLFDRTGAGELRRGMLLFLAGSLCFAAVYQGCLLFPDTGESLEALRRDLFSAAKYQVMFWL